MKMTLTIAAAVATAMVVTLVPEVVDAQYGHMHRATRRRTAVVVSSATKSADAAQVSQANQQAATAQQQAATSQQQAAASQQEAAAANQRAAAAEQEAAAAKQAAAAAPPPAVAGQPLPLGSVVGRLPAGCVSTPVGGVEYYYCGGNFYRAMFQENTLVYVTVKPK